MSLLSAITKPFRRADKTKSGEGSWRGPFDGMGELGNSFVLDPFEDGWNRNLQRNTQDWRVPVVYASVMLSARAITQCDARHIVQQPNGGYEKSKTSPASRIFRSPNQYETLPQILTNTVADMLFHGESIWLALRDERYAIREVHRIPYHSWTIHYAQEEGAIFYQINTKGDLFSNPDMLVPARDICHFRQHCPRHALVGESPLKNAALAVGLQVALNQSQLAFFSNLDRPSGTIQTDLELSTEQVTELRARFSEQSKKWNQGGTPILSHGLKFSAVGIAQSDAQLVEQQKLSALDISRVFGVPYALISDGSGPQGGTEALVTHWLSIGLGSLIESIERSLDKLFKLGMDERIELDPTPLLRVDQASLFEFIGNAVQKGVLTPNEARRRVRLSDITGGDDAFLQRQMTSLDLLSQLNEAELSDPIAPRVEEEADTEQGEKAFNSEYVKALIANRLLRIDS